MKACILNIYYLYILSACINFESMYILESALNQIQIGFEERIRMAQGVHRNTYRPTVICLEDCKFGVRVQLLKFCSAHKDEGNPQIAFFFHLL